MIFLLAPFFACTSHPPVQPASGGPEESGLPETPPEVNAKALQHFLDGEMLGLQGNYPMAILEYQDALVFDPSAPAILTSLASAYLRLGKFDRAEERLKEALSYDPKYRGARELLGHQYMILGRLDQAEEQYRLLTDFYPRESDYRYVLAEISLRKGNREEAQQQFWQIYDHDHRETRALGEAAEVARERKDFPFAFKAYELLTKSDPSNVQYWRAYSELAVVLQEFSRAISGLERLLELTRDDPRVREQLAILYYDNDDPDKAYEIFRRLRGEGHSSPAVLYYLGRIAMDKEDYDTAGKYSLELVEDHPQEVTGYTNLAIAYINLDRSLDAINILLKARDRFPENFAVNFLLGNSYSMQKNYVLAKKSLLSALTFSPESRSAKHLLATVYNRLEEWESSDKLYRELLETDEDDSQALNNYSYTLVERGINLELALQMARKAISLEPDNPAYLDTIGWIYFNMGDNEKAMKYIRKSLEIEGDNPVVLEHLGDILVTSHQREEAVNYYKKALELDPDNERLTQKVNQ
ncbi:MAG: tetratricopeptide repeat protein [Fidelibacterota bacterium]